MHTPFSVSQLIRPEDVGTDPITAILLHANRIILGTEKGALLVFDLSNLANNGLAAATLVSRTEEFSKKSIDQLGVIKELNALVCLSGGDINLFALSTFSPLSTFAPQTRTAASLFVLSTTVKHSVTTTSSTSTSQANAPEIHTTLAVACRRKLILFNWIDAVWIPPLEVALPHQIRGMAFSEGDLGKKIVAGFSTGEYGIVALPSLSSQTNTKDAASQPTLGDLFTPTLPTAIASTSPAAQSSNNPLGLTALGHYGERFGGIAKATGGLAKATGNVMGLGVLGMGTKKIEKNLVVGLGSGTGAIKGNDSDATAWLFGKEWGWESDDPNLKGEIIVARDHIALPLRASGRPRSSNAVISYNPPPDEMIVLAPYIIALLPSPIAPQPLPATTSSPVKLSPSRASPTLSIHTVTSLAHVQTLQVPPIRISPPASISDTTSLSSTDTPQISVARLLTIATASAQSPILLLTTSPTSSTLPPTVPTTAEQTIWMVSMKGWESQILELGQRGEWDSAIALVRRSGSGGSDLSAGLLRRLSILQALSLFKQKLFDLAIDAFIALDLSPSKIIALFPLAISGKLVVNPTALESIFGGRSQVDVEIQLEEEVGRAAEEETLRKEIALATEEKLRRGRVGEEDGVAGKGSVGRRMGSSSGWLRERNDAAETLENLASAAADDRAKQDATREKLAAHDLSRSIDVLIRYLTDRRQKYAQALSSLHPSLRPSPSAHLAPATPAELLALPDLPLTELKPEQLVRVAQVVDTALFRSYLATKPVLVGALCRIENWCEVEEVEELLVGAKKYRELLDLYNGKSMHEKAVKLLRKMSDDEEDPEEKVGPTVRYLQKLGADHLDLIFESSRWIFDVDLDAGLEIFIADLEEVESLPRHATMAHLEKIDSKVCMIYLEHIIITLGEAGSEFHEKLIELYLNLVRLPETKAGEEKPVRNEEDYLKLLDFLESSTSYRADRILGRLPSEDMFEVRALLLGRLGRHEGALQIYVYQLDDHATAEEYCARVYEAIPAMRSTIFHILLKIYLRPRQNHPLLYTPALSLLANHAGSIDPIEVFDLLPPLVALSDIKVFLEKTLRKSVETKRATRVVRGVGKSCVEENMASVVQLEERRVKITDSRICPQCYKRLGNSVIAIHSPNGEVTHYQCREKFQENKQRVGVP